MKEGKEVQPTHKNLPTWALIASPTNQNLGELLWRVGIPISALVLVLLAIPMSFVNPRAGRSANLLFALLTYIVYSNLLSVSQARVAQGRMDFGVGWWLVHAGMVALLVVMFAQRMQLIRLQARQVALEHRAPSSATSRARSTARPRFVLLGFLGLFAFFDLIRELADLGKVDYQLRQVFTFVLLSMPTHAYELFPVVVLIGTLYVLAHLAEQLRVHGDARLGPVAAARRRSMLAKIGLAFVVLTFVIGEWVAPMVGGAGAEGQAARA